MKKKLVDKYCYDKALNILRGEHYKITLQLRTLEDAEYDQFGDLVRFEDEIPLTEHQEQIMWEQL